ncbi:unnamed protein product [Hermetia illucens]|uniref:Uncharacterized protein n=1 Tax=Hermetia illucens TaxID=343691 RepID=A0A7R8YVE3_HERIL|nr:general odorant-binding protein 99a-like isoform X3 [Hermetia illucens]CAD7087202.1 unnamed protein product [Hermetia illucens]
MKILISLFAIFVLVTADWKPRNREQLIKDRDECFKSENLSEHCIDEIKRRTFPHEPKCYFRCVLMKNSVWDDTSGYNVEKAYKELTHNGFELSKQDLNKCNSEEMKNNDSCVWAGNVVKCTWDYLPKKKQD